MGDDTGRAARTCRHRARLQEVRRRRAARFLSAAFAALTIAGSQRWPVYVHCAEGKERTGYAIAAYRIIDPVWFGNPAFLRRLAERRTDIAARVARMP